jgi:hypothetical protein
VNQHESGFKDKYSEIIEKAEESNLLTTPEGMAKAWED